MGRLSFSAESDTRCWAHAHETADWYIYTPQKKTGDQRCPGEGLRSGSALILDAAPSA